MPVEGIDEAVNFRQKILYLGSLLQDGLFDLDFDCRGNNKVNDVFGLLLTTIGIYEAFVFEKIKIKIKGLQKISKEA